jgi:hypothetical protein
MELSPARQKLLFVVIVVVLAVLGYYLVLPATHHKNGTAASPAATSSTVPAAPLATVTPAAPPVVVQTPAAGAVNIYNWLPFSQQDLADAAAVTTQFCVDYNTYTYTESATAYLAKMNGLVVSGLAAVLKDGYTTPGTASLRTAQKWISSGTATIETLRAFGQTSLTFVVSTAQHLVTSGGTQNKTTPYAVTLTGSGTNWQVSDIELASAGNT